MVRHLLNIHKTLDSILSPPKQRIFSSRYDGSSKPTQMQIRIPKIPTSSPYHLKTSSRIVRLVSKFFQQIILPAGSWLTFGVLPLMTTRGRAFNECHFFLSLHNTFTKDIPDSVKQCSAENPILPISVCFLSNTTMSLLDLLF